MHDLNAFFALLKSIRLTAEEFAEVRARLAPGTLSTAEHLDIAADLHTFVRAHPVQAPAHADVTFHVWHGGNIFRCLRPFVLSRACGVPLPAR